MQYKTNQLDKNGLFSLENYKNIAQNFWVYKFTTINPSYQYSLIDDLKQDLINVKSVVYLQGKIFYALFEKSKFKNESDLENKISEFLKKSDEVQSYQITNLRDENEIDKRHLAQLLFNSLTNTSNKNTKKSNITGGLYWVVKTVEAKEKADTQKLTWQYITLKLELDYHLHLKLDVKTFSNLLMTGKMNFANRKTQFKDYPQYEILSDNIRSMRRLKSNEYNKKPENTYILAQADGKKSTVSFLDFSNWESFERTKNGVLYLFLKEAKEHIGKYLTIKFLELPFGEEKTEFDKHLSESVKARIQNFYRTMPIVINIADSLKDDSEAKELAQNLQNFLSDKERDYKVPDVSIGNLQIDALTIRVIRNKSYYETNKLTDEYCKDKNYLVHHITTDDFDIELEQIKKGITKRLSSSPAIDVILKESYIKNDIRQGKITILDWAFGEWIFMGKEEVKTEEESKDKKYNYHLLKVSENGKLTFNTCLHNQVFAHTNDERYKAIYNQYDKFNGREFLNCLLVSNHQDINLIFETPLFTIQEIEKIGETLELENQETEIPKEKIIAMLEKFILENKSFETDKKLDNTFSTIKSFNSKITKDELNKIFEEIGLTNKTKIKKAFCLFYYENSEFFLGKKDVLHHFFKGKEDIEGLFASNTNIYYQINNETEAFYFVGIVPKQIKTSFQNATNIRKIKAVKNLQGQQSKLVFDKLLETMNVDFVKQGSLTVLPFAFKYLREINK